VRIGVIGPMGHDFFADNIADALLRMGHYVIPLGSAHAQHHRSRLANRAVSIARQGWPSIDEAIQRRIARRALNASCEVVVNVDSHLLPDAVARLQRGGARVAFWFPDHVANLGRELMLLGSYDGLFFKEPHLVERLRATLDLPVYYLPEACNPRWHRPLVPAGTEPYFVVAGTMRPSRVRLIERLMAKGIPLKLYGGIIPRWLGDSPIRAVHAGHPILREEKARIFRSAAGVLNTLYSAEVVGVNARLFEAAGSGAAVLTEFRPSLPELFDVGYEVLAYHDFDGLVDQANRLLSEDGLTARIGDAATRRAHGEHTYDLRLATILEKLS
jgi:spore maturation protein CgeB